MAITYPLVMPTFPGPKSGSLEAISPQAVVASTFSNKIQVQSFAADRWMAKWTFPPIKPELAGPWISFVTALRNLEGSFLATPHLAQYHRGPLTRDDPEIPVRVSGDQQTGRTLVIDGFEPNVTGWAQAGDYFSYGTGADTKFFMITENVDTPSGGDVEISVFPNVVTSPDDNTDLVLNMPQALFRLTSKPEWKIDNLGFFNIAISGEEL